MKKSFLKMTLLFGLSFGLTFANSLMAQENDKLKAQYEADLLYCESPSVTDKQTCKREASAAYSEALKGNLQDVHNGAKANRCQYLHGEQKTDCEMLMQNPDAKITGSVESGGIIRSMEYEYTPAPADGAKTQDNTGSNTQTYSVD